jgi:hypothetical protein
MDYQLNYRETGSFLRSRQLDAVARQAAQDVAEEARAIVAAEAYDTGALYDSITIEPSPTRDRAGWAVVADDTAAAPTEFGNERVPGAEVEHFLARAAQQAGFDIVGGVA